MRGDRAYWQVFGQKGTNITITLAISPVFGLRHHSIHVGDMNQERFAEFLQHCANALERKLTSFLTGRRPIVTQNRQPIMFIYECHHRTLPP